MKAISHNMSTPARNRRGVTLRELLLFVAVSCFGAAVLYRATEPRRQREYSTACAGNLGSLGLAMQMYTNDFNETLPRTWFGKDAGPSDANRNYKWMDAVAPYTKSEYFNCPADKKRNRYRYRDGTHYGSYVFNNAYFVPGDKLTPPAGTPLSKIEHMSATVMLLEGDNAFQFAWPDVRSTPPMTTGLPRRLDTIITRHHDVAMQLYIDGHCKGNRLEVVAHQKSINGRKIYTSFTIENDEYE